MLSVRPTGYDAEAGVDAAAGVHGAGPVCQRGMKL
jgi:hypothetical protein